MFIKIPSLMKLHDIVLCVVGCQKQARDLNRPQNHAGWGTWESVKFDTIKLSFFALYS